MVHLLDRLGEKELENTTKRHCGIILREILKQENIAALYVEICTQIVRDTLLISEDIYVRSIMCCFHHQNNYF